LTLKIFKKKKVAKKNKKLNDQKKKSFAKTIKRIKQRTASNFK